MGKCNCRRRVNVVDAGHRSLPQTPVYVYADEFYNFAYEGFIDGLNKLRDAHVSFLLAHQTFADLERVSKEFARGVWENARNKILLYQNDPLLAELVARSIGTKKDVEATNQRSVDMFMNSVATHNASTKEVDAYCFHPNRLKSLKLGQAYLVQDANFFGLTLAEMPAVAPARPAAPKAQTPDGIGLHELFLDECVAA